MEFYVNLVGRASGRGVALGEAEKEIAAGRL